MFRLRTLRREECGQAMVEFVIVFPVLFVFFLTIVQSALLMSARQVVHYAAFCAARAAMVGFDENQSARAAQLACAPIVPRISVAELAQYRSGLLNVIRGLSGLGSEYPELAGRIAAAIPYIPGLDMGTKLTGLGGVASSPGLTAGLSHLDSLAGGSVSERFYTSYILTNVRFFYFRDGKDVTAGVTHNYAMRVPVINKIFYYMYLNYLVDAQITRAGGGLPSTVTEDLRKESIKAFDELTSSNVTVPLYVMPIRARCTLPVEQEVTHGPCCN